MDTRNETVTIRRNAIGFIALTHQLNAQAQYIDVLNGSLSSWGLLVVAPALMAIVAGLVLRLRSTTGKKFAIRVCAGWVMLVVTCILAVTSGIDSGGLISFLLITVSVWLVAIAMLVGLFFVKTPHA